MKSKPIVIIGAGIGGLSSAIYLAKSGQRVIVYEQQPQVGGKMAEIKQDGFRWDAGPSVLTMRWVLEDLFISAGKKLSDYLQLEPIEPITRYFFPDGTVLDVTRDLSKMAEQIAQIEPRDVEGYLAYLAYAARLQRITGNAFINGPPPSLATFRQVEFLDVFRFDPFRTMQSAINRFVRSPKLRQLLGRFATYVGASPFLAPATLNVIGHVELTGGVWYPRGGIYTIARALEKLAGELGVEIHLNQPVEKIWVHNGRANGVYLANGQTIEARMVIANVDVARTYERLLPVGNVSKRQIQKLINMEPSCSGFVMLMGIKGEYPELAHHNIFFNRDYRNEFDDIFKRGIPPGEPTLFICITSKTDPQHAPPGCENWYILVNAPPLSERFNWQGQAEHYTQVIHDRLAQFGYYLHDRIVTQQLRTPEDIERLTGAHRGALYGLNSNDRLSAFRRPHNRSRDIQGLFFCGGTTHPGGGVPMVMLSGKLAAKMVLEDLGE